LSIYKWCCRDREEAKSGSSRGSCCKYKVNLVLIADNHNATVVTVS